LEANVGEKADQAAIEAYSAIAMTFARGLLRLHRSRVALALSSVAMLKLHRDELPERDGHPLWEVVDDLLAVEFAEFDSFQYIGDISHLVYAAAVFDTFLTETTRFLFLRQPAALGKDCKVPLETVINARSRPDILNQIVEAKTRELAFKGLKERLKVLQMTFGLKPALSKNDLELLAEFADTRNTILHDQGFFEIRISAGDKLTVKQRACPQRPTPISSEDSKKTYDAYEQATAAIAKSVFTQVLKVSKGSSAYRTAARLFDGEPASPEPTAGAAVRLD
jgi:hypothetical protein